MNFSGQYITAFLVRLKRSCTIAKWLFFFYVYVNILNITSRHLANIKNVNWWTGGHC